MPPIDFNDHEALVDLALEHPDYPEATVRHIKPKPLAETLYHYTSAAGLVGIAESKQLHLTNASCVNDASDTTYGFHIASNYANHILDTRGDGITAQHSIFLHTLQLRLRVPSLDIYIASFSTDPDLLYQWQAYCPTEGGYAIGFDGQELRAKAKAFDALLIPCEYDKKIAQAEITTLVDIFVEFFNQYCSTYQPTTHKQLESAAHACAELCVIHLIYASTLIKHSSFDTENEHRIVFRRIQHPKTKKKHKIHFRHTSTQPVPYLKMPLPINHGKLHATHLRADQRIHPAKHKALFLLAQHLIAKGAKIDASAIPLQHV